MSVELFGRKVLKGIAICVLTLATIVSMVALVIQPKDFKREIAAFVTYKIGLDVFVEGDIELSFFPEIKVTTGRVLVNNPPGFKIQPFLVFDQGEMRIKLWPLLTQKIEITGISLVNLTVNLQRNKQGLDNWAVWAAQKSTPFGKEILKKDNGVSALFSFAIGPVHLQNACVTWDNGQVEKQMAFKDIEFNSGKIVAGNSFPINLSLAISGSPIKSETRLKLTALIRPDEKFNEIEINNSHLEYTGFNPLSSSTMLSAEISSQQIKISRPTKALTISNMQIQSQGFTLFADLSGEQRSDNPAFHGHIRIPPFNPRTVIKPWGLELPQMKSQAALTNVSLDFNFNASVGFANVSGLSMQLDDSAISGFVTVKQVTQPSILFDIAIDEIEADKYLPVETKMKKNRNGDAVGEMPRLIESIKALDANGQLQIGKLTLNNAVSKEIRLKLSSKKGFAAEQLFH